MKIKLSFNHIAALGLLLFVLLQILLTMQALGLSQQATETVQTISGPLSLRLKNLTALDKSLSKSYYLYQLDKNIPRISPEELLAPLVDFDGQLHVLLQTISSSGERDLLSRCLDTTKILHQRASNLSEQGHPHPLDDRTALVEQMQRHSAAIRTLLTSLTVSFGKKPQGGRLVDLHKASEQLSLFDTRLQAYLKAHTLDITGQIHAIVQAEATLDALLSPGSDVNEDDQKKVRALKSLLTLLRTNLPSVYYGQRLDPRISLAEENLISLDQTWEQMLTVLTDLRNSQEQKISQTSEKLRTLTTEKRLRFFLIASFSIGACLIMAVLLRSILASRIKALVAGTQKIAKGDFHYRLEIMSKDHLGALAQSFNTMAETLAAKDSELHKNLEQLRVSKMQLGLSHLELEERVMQRTADLSAANEQLQLMAEVFEHALEGIIILDEQGTIIDTNPSFTKLTGYTTHEALGKDTRFLETNETGLTSYAEIQEIVSTEGAWEGEVWCRRKDDDNAVFWLSLSTMRNNDEQTTGFIAIFHDISELKTQAALIQHQALHDPLTELPNRVLLKDRMDVAISHASRSAEKLAVIFLDLDNFKTINDSLGHDHGDILLQNVATRLLKLVRPGDTVCRMGGDEFVVLVDNLEAKDGVRTVAKRIQKELNSVFPVKGRNLFISSSIGIAFFPDDGSDSDTLIKHADLAMYQAKGKGKNTIQLFTASMNKAALERLALEEEIRDGMGHDQFMVHLQPKIALDSGAVVGLEALARWENPSRGLVSPTTFIPICEEAGLIIPLGLHILEDACLRGVELIKAWPQTPLHIAINLSIKQLQHENIVNDIKRVMAVTGIKAANLEFEITESVLMSDPDRSLKILHSIAEMGISIAIDDFGTGYSSLFYLKHFPVSTLKIDKSFIDDITTDASSAQIVETIIAMAQRLHLKVVAEGVETKAQLEHLRTLGCDMVQGYFFSKPLTPQDVLTFLSSFKGH